MRTQVTPGAKNAWDQVASPRGRSSVSQLEEETNICWGKVALLQSKHPSLTPVMLAVVYSGWLNSLHWTMY